MKTEIFRNFNKSGIKVIIGRFPPSVYTILLVAVITLILRPHMLQPKFILIMARQAAPLGLAVLGQLLVIGIGTIDLSIGGVFLFVNYILSSGVFGDSPLLLLVISLVFGVAVGAINGVLVGKLKASAFIITLGMGALVVGVVIYLSSGKPPGAMPELIKFIGGGRLGTIPVSGIIWVVLAVLISIFLRITAYGRLIRAIGDNPVAASISGLPVDTVVVTNHILSGLFAALGGILLAGFIGMGRMEQTSGVDLNSIAAVVLGGILFGKGRLTVYGPFLGIWTVTILTSLLFTVHIGEPGKLLVQAAILYVALLVQQLRTRKPV